MKKLFSLSILSFIIIFTACEGPSGPPGPIGPQGDPGVNIVGEVFEVEVDFTAAENYAALFILDPEIYPDDVILAYREWATEDGTSIWRLLPQTVYFGPGVILQYNYDFTAGDFGLFLDGTVDFATLDSDFLDNQYFRIVVVPGDNAASRMDFSNYDTVMEMLGKKESDIKPLKIE